MPEKLRATYGDTLVTRAVACEILGISKAELRRRESDNIYPHIRDEKGVVWYDEKEIRHIARGSDIPEKKKASVQGKSTAIFSMAYTTETAAAVFKKLDDATPLTKIVQECNVHPETALAIQEAYGRVVGGLFITKEQLAMIAERVPMRGAWPPKNFEECLSTLSASASPAKCAKCMKLSARVCASCATGMTSGAGGASAA